MNAGTFSATTGKFRLTTPLSRILNKGDGICLYLTNFDDLSSQDPNDAIKFNTVIKYMITYE